jgi:hypothetical protein
MPTHKGEYGRTHGQAYRLGEAKAKAAGPGNDMTQGEGKDNEVDGEKGGNIVAIKHSGRGADGKAMPPFHVKHEDGSVSKHDTHEDLMGHLDEHMGGGMKDEDEDSNDGGMGDIADGSKDAIESLLG